VHPGGPLHDWSMRKRRIWLQAATGILVATLGVVGFLGLVTANNALDRCATDSRAPSAGGHVDYGPLPWQWTCQYDDGTEVMRSLFDDRSA